LWQIVAIRRIFFLKKQFLHQSFPCFSKKFSKKVDQNFLKITMFMFPHIVQASSQPRHKKDFNEFLYS
jgi:hypothetical protein